MKTNKIILSILYLTLTITTTGLARYKSAPLQRISSKKTKMINKIPESIAFDYKVLSKKKCKKYFNSKNIANKGYKSIQISFINNSKNYIEITPDKLNFLTVNYQEITRNLYRSSVARGVGFGIGALWFLPLIFPAFVQGLGAHKYNEDMDLNFSNKSLKTQVIPPYTTVDGVIFTSNKNFNKNFTMTVKNIDTKEYITIHST